MTGSNREFVYEASSQIERLSDGFVELQREGFDRGTLDDLFRDAHTLKGNCSAAGFAEPAETAHALEDLLDGLRTRPDAFDEAYVDAALEALDVLERQLMDLQTNGRVETDAEDVVASIRDLVPDATDAADADGADSAIALEGIELPSVEAGEDVSVEEALENAAVFDDLEELEGSVDAEGFEDVEGVGLFDADDGAAERGDSSGSAGGSSELTDAAVAPDEGEANASGERSAANGVESSTRRDSDAVPGEASYAEMVSNTSLADPDDLQSELEDVTFGEFDDDDDLSIGELVDLADDAADAVDADDAADAADADDAVDADVSDSTTSDGEPDGEDPADDASDGVASGVDGALEADVFSLEDDDSSTVASTTEDATDHSSLATEDATAESASATGSPSEGESEFEFGQTEGVQEAEADAAASGAPAEGDGAGETGRPEGGSDPVVEPLDLDTTGGADVDSIDTEPSDDQSGAAAGDESEGGVTAGSDGEHVEVQREEDAAATDASVVDIVSRIERLEEGVDGTDSDRDSAVDRGTGSADENAVGGETESGGEVAAGREEPVAAAEDGVAVDAEDGGALDGEDGGTLDGEDGGTLDGELSDVLDAATAAPASSEDADVLPSDVPDVDRILEDTEFEDVEDVEFATAEFYDRVGFETDSSTGAFVSEFGEAFEDDATGFETDAGTVAFDASSTIDPAVLDADAAGSDDQPSSMETVREVTLGVEEADSLLELAEELVVDTQRLAGALGDVPPAAADALASLRDVSSRIEDHVSNVRLVPLSAAFSGLPRTSRRVARNQDKEVAFLTENGDVEVDRRVVDELADPLVHLVRNAVDHGIEPPDERVANGKPAEGTVLVRAERTGDAVTVAVEDDGRGADPDELRAAAVDAGLYTPAEANALSRADALELMFHAGLSTTDEVSEVSGRGVGMDVVSDVVTRLEGTLDVRSEPGVGTTVELTLPVSVALSDVLTVAVGSRRFGLPATDVRRVEEFVPERVDGDEYRLLTGDDEVEHVPIVDLSAALDRESALDVDDDSRPGPARTDVLVLTDDPDPRAFRCRDVVDWESVVLQPFDGVLAAHALARGAALTGDGSPVVVLEPAELGGDR